MTLLRELPVQRLQFYLTASYDCSYLSDRQARSQVVTPGSLVDTAIFSELARMGFRRSGLYVYRPRCDACSACVPVRVPVARFQANRSQRRCLARNQDVLMNTRALDFDETHFRLYGRYQKARHTGGGMDQDDREQYRTFLLSSRVDSFLVEFSLGGQVIMVSLIDRLLDGLSAVYTFYDPDLVRRSLGVYGVLSAIGLARQMGLEYLYLGYWIAATPKMAYKANYRPLQAYRGGHWAELATEEG